MARTLALLGVLLFPLLAPAATCTWNTPSGNWSLASNWSGCADSAGPSTRAPGSGDIAVLVNGTANLDASPTVAEFELGSDGLLSVVGGTKTFDVTSKLRFAGGHATTVLGTNQLLLHLHAGGTGSLLAPTTLENAVFFENSGTLTLGSASGVALTLLVASEVRNMPGATITIAGGNSRLYLDGSSQLVNNAGATLTISGNTLIGRATPASNYAIVQNLGTMVRASTHGIRLNPKLFVLSAPLKPLVLSAAGRSPAKSKHLLASLAFRAFSAATRTEFGARITARRPPCAQWKHAEPGWPSPHAAYPCCGRRLRGQATTPPACSRTVPASRPSRRPRRRCRTRNRATATRRSPTRSPCVRTSHWPARDPKRRDWTNGSRASWRCACHPERRAPPLAR